MNSCRKPARVKRKASLLRTMHASYLIHSWQHNCILYFCSNVVVRSSMYCGARARRLEPEEPWFGGFQRDKTRNSCSICQDYLIYYLWKLENPSRLRQTESCKCQVLESIPYENRVINVFVCSLLKATQAAKIDSYYPEESKYQTKAQLQASWRFDTRALLCPT